MRDRAGEEDDLPTLDRVEEGTLAASDASRAYAVPSDA